MSLGRAFENKVSLRVKMMWHSEKSRAFILKKMELLQNLGYELGADYDDPKWEEVLNQLTEEETEELFLHGYVKTEELESIGKPLAREADGPAQIGSFNQNPTGTGFPNAGVMAQSWNTGLSRDMGRAVAKEAGQFGYSGWYAPAVNLHRSPFDGRNYEYYSEDSSAFRENVRGSGKLEVWIWGFTVM